MAEEEAGGSLAGLLADAFKSEPSPCLVASCPRASSSHHKQERGTGRVCVCLGARHSGNATEVRGAVRPLRGGRLSRPLPPAQTRPAGMKKNSACSSPRTASSSRTPTTVTVAARSTRHVSSSTAEWAARTRSGVTSHRGSSASKRSRSRCQLPVLKYDLPTALEDWRVAHLWRCRWWGY